MSMDHLHECSFCKEQKAVMMWIRLYGSLAQARLGHDAAAALLPGPAIVKVEVCFACNRFSPTLNYTVEEHAELDEYNRQQKNAVEKFGLS